MIPFRKIHILGNPKVGKARGPLIWSGSEFALVQPVGAEMVTFRIIYWFPVPPERRVKTKNQTEVPNATDAEKRMLADGVFEEWAFNVRWPADMKTPEAVQRLKVDYARRYEKQVGPVPADLFTSDAAIIRNDATSRLLA